MRRHFMLVLDGADWRQADARGHLGQRRCGAVILLVLVLVSLLILSCWIVAGSKMLGGMRVLVSQVRKVPVGESTRLCSKRHAAAYTRFVN